MQKYIISFSVKIIKVQRENKHQNYKTKYFKNIQI